LFGKRKFAAREVRDSSAKRNDAFQRREMPGFRRHDDGQWNTAEARETATLASAIAHNRCSARDRAVLRA
jgi:hypothetical protein